MNTIALQPSVKRTSVATEINVVLGKLQRYQKDLNSLIRRLNCYTCEPRTYELWSRMDVLKTAIVQLGSENKDLMKTMVLNSQHALAQVKSIFHQVTVMQEEVDHYVIDARKQGCRA